MGWSRFLRAHTGELARNGLLEGVLDGSAPAGIYRFAGMIGSDELVREATRQGWHAAQINGAAINNKAAFLEAIARAFAFPGYFGRNWDALEESIHDLSWAKAPGYLLVYGAPWHFAAACPKEWQIALDILREAAGYWASQGKPFYVLLRRTRGSAPEAPLLR